MDVNHLQKRYQKARIRAADYVRKSYDHRVDFRFTPNSDASAFSRCFGIFCYNFLNIQKELEPQTEQIIDKIMSDLDEFKLHRFNIVRDILLDKHYLQLICFSLSAISCISPNSLNKIDPSSLIGTFDKLEEAIEKALSQRDRSTFGNINMAHAVLLIWLKNVGAVNTTPILQKWINTHLQKMNKFGFWGENKRPSYLQFQNGYHQYEILDFLGIQTKKDKEAAQMVSMLADFDGHFAPYPGGGGCYDFDATFMITRLSGKALHHYENLLLRTADYPQPELRWRF